MGKSAGNYRIKKKLPEALKQVNPDKFQLEEILAFYEKEHGTYYTINRIASLLKPYAFAVGNRSRAYYWTVREKWRHLYEEENSDS